ncbi:MAG TPA: prenyltransferase/squalene oxidase repeat-containing protein [Gemmataceae bacterium]|jgi:geranylgeranyl transferase type-2 subunit beta|nr:prenyltransferase/squalene oxidase repeat-containing protein [Gemmataceae bacterium]
MPSTTYLENLARRITDGLRQLPEEFRARHRTFLHARQNEDGGFPGRDGGSDLYYTGFALRSLAVLDGLTIDVTDRAAGFLRRSLTQQASVVDFFSLLYAALLIQINGGPDVFSSSPPDWPERVAATLETFRTPDGGYAKTPGSHAGSTYHTFLVCLTYQLLNKTLPRSEVAVQFVRSRQREDGGYVEISPMRRSGTNPTAAAIGILQILDALGSTDAVIDFLIGMPSVEGGLRANGRAPLADLLSTFTGLWTLHQLDAMNRIDAHAVLRYAQALELPGGGFRGGLWDDRTDVEYTFYGLAVLALVGP